MKINTILIIIIVLVLIIATNNGKKESFTYIQGSESYCNSKTQEYKNQGYKCVTECLKLTSEQESCIRNKGDSSFSSYVGWYIFLTDPIDTCSEYIDNVAPRYDALASCVELVSACNPSCSCSQNTCIGQTCSNGCGGTCQGTKDCSVPPPPPTEISAIIINFLSGQYTMSTFISSMNSWITPPNIVSLDDYLNANPNVKTKFDGFGTVKKERVTAFFNELESSGSINMPKPQSFAIYDTNNDGSFDSSPSEYILTNGELDILNAALIARAIWIDKHHFVSWRLNDYSNSELNILFELDTMYQVIDYSPSISYNIAKKYIKPSKTETVYGIINEWKNGGTYGYPFRHGSSNIDGTTLVTYEYMMTHVSDYVQPMRVAREGCQSMSQLFAQTLRAINIPADVIFGWYNMGHAGTSVPGIGVMLHGDHFYSSAGAGLCPPEKTMMSWDYFVNQMEPCGSMTQCSKDKQMAYTWC